jgi:hypothetical protein
MSANVILSDEDCHWIVPVLPLKVIKVEFVPEQTDVDPLMLPATETGLTVTATLAVVAGAQTLLVTTAW